MTRAASLARWTAIAIAVAAAWDPRVSLPRLERPSIRVLTPDASPKAASLADALRAAGFRLDGADRELARLTVGRVFRPGAEVFKTATDLSRPAVAPVALWALDTTPRPPNVAIGRASGPDVRLPQQAIEVRVTVDAQGMNGRTTELLMEDAGIPVASAKHQWTKPGERWTASLQYLPPTAGGGRLRIIAAPLAGETSSDDNTADVAIPPMRGPVRTLIVEAGVTWPALFVRRAIEGEPAFAVSAVQRASQNIAARAGSPPAALTRATLAPYEVALVGGPDNLAAADLEALRWFVEERGGVIVLVPDQRPAGRYLSLAGVDAFESRTVDEAVRLRGAGGDLLATEWVTPRVSPASARTLAATSSGDMVVFSVRRGAGAVVFGGALDAWRYRGRDQEGFARFWRRAIADEAAAVSPALDVRLSPALARPGEAVRVTARLRSSELPAGVARFDLPAIAARASGPGAHVDEPLRLWPTAEPGVYEGDWQPPAAGAYALSVALGEHRGDAPLVVDAAVAHGSDADPESLALAARASGGQVFTADRSSALVDAMRAAYPARRVARPSHPMRSPWWVAPFALLLSTEWLLRRKAGKA
jgi:hypothetical protein